MNLDTMCPIKKISNYPASAETLINISIVYRLLKKITILFKKRERRIMHDWVSNSKSMVEPRRVLFHSK